MLIYALLHLTGAPGLSIYSLTTFRQWGSKTAGHPERGHAPGVEFTTSPLGQGLVSPVGMALAERILATELGGHLVDHRTWAICGDGCFQEGIGQGALSLAGHLGLCKLKEIWDDNAVTIDGHTQISFSEDVPARAHACGWHVVSADGHDVATIDTALTQATSVTDRPSFVALKTTIGLGAPTKSGTASCHGSPLGGTEAEGDKVALGWTHPALMVPDDFAARWKEFGARGASAREARLTPNAAEFRRRMAGDLPKGNEAAVAAARAALFAKPKAVATRKASQIVMLSQERQSA